MVSRNKDPGAAPISSTRRREIVQIAAQVFAERGFVGATVRDIGKAANVLSGSLYHHFSSKEEIAAEILDEYWTRLFDLTDQIVAAGGTPTEKLSALIRDTLLVDADLHLNVQLLLNDWHYLLRVFPDLAVSMNGLESRWVAVLKTGVAAGEFREDLDVKLMYRSIMASINGLNRWYKPGGQQSMDEIAQTQVSLWVAAVSHQPADLERA